MVPSSNTNTNTGRRPAAGLVAAALLALSATTGEAARISNAASASRRMQQQPQAPLAPPPPNSQPKPADAMFVNGPQCVKCCGAPPEVREDGTMGTMGPPGSPGAGKGTKKSAGGKGSSGTNPTRRMKNRRLASRRGTEEEEQEEQEERQLEHKDSTKCVECPAGQAMCELTEADYVQLETTIPFPGMPKVVKCDGDVPPCPASEALKVSNEYLVNDSDLTVSAGYAAPENLSDQGGCGTKAAGSKPTQVNFWTKVQYYPDKISEAAVAEHLQGNLGPKAFCPAVVDAPMPPVISAATASPGGRKLEEAVVTGFVPCGGQFARAGSTTCNGAIEGTTCATFTGAVCVACNHGAAHNECFAAGFKMLQENANKATDPDTIPSVEVVGAQMDPEVSGGAQDVMGGGGATTSSILGAETATAAGASSLGIVIGAVLGVCALLVVVLLARKNRKAYNREISFVDAEDMDSLDGDNIHLKPGDSSFDGTEIMSDGGTPSPRKWRKSRPGHVVGEEDSVLSGNRGPRMIPRELSYSEGLEIASPHDLGRNGSGVNVHQCNSAMCEICLARGANPRFIPSNALEGAFVGDDDRLNSSDLSYGSRSYPMEDTVDF